MQLSLPWRYGTGRPFSSIPRINWAHPLAAGLTSYVYDAGGGVTVDLVNGGVGKLVTEASSTPATISASKYGNGWKLSDQGAGSGGGLHSSRIEFPNLQATYLNSIINSGPKSFATGFVFTSASDLAALFSVCNQFNDTYFGICVSLLTAIPVPQCFTDNSGGTVQGGTGAPIKVGAFSTIAGVSSASTTNTMWWGDDTGPFNKISNTQSLSSYANPMLPCIGDLTAGATGAGAHQNCCVAQVFYGAFWRNRTLTDEEFVQLQTDPYCLLWYPEDDIFATLVGSLGFTGPMMGQILL